ncbi:MAG: hypothetical protein HKP61_07850 [Dactylosporangium sp.]|nr:hypothetical protein [Dactylosporangium sp.]NNJ60849.1 hypothetical protein [Dactylosporangium sp.]
MLRGQAATPQHPAADYFARRTERGVRVFAAMVAKRQQAGLAHPGLGATEVARQIVALWDGLHTMWINDPSFDLGTVLYHAVRRLTGENCMAVRDLINRPDVGL